MLEHGFTEVELEILMLVLRSHTPRLGSSMLGPKSIEVGPKETMAIKLGHWDLGLALMDKGQGIGDLDIGRRDLGPRLNGPRYGHRGLGPRL